MDQVRVFAQHSFQLPLARLLLQIHAVSQHWSPAASCSGWAAQGTAAGAVRPAPPAGLPRRGRVPPVRRGRVGFVGPGMLTAERLVHPVDGTAESGRRRRRKREEEEGIGMDQKQQQQGRSQQSMR